MLIINGSLLENSGLWYGKMGVAIFFFYYGRFTGNDLYEDYAMEVIDAIRAEIHHDSAADYARGLAGIGAGIEFLSQNGFLDINSDEILEDFDSRIRSDIMYRQQENNNIADGLCGLGLYLFHRLNCSQADELHLLTNREMMLHIVNILENEEKFLPDDLPAILSFLCRLYSLDICNPKIERCIEKVLKDFSIDDIPDVQLHSWTLALLRLAFIQDQTADLACQILERSLQTMENDEQSFVDADMTSRLLWLLQCKRLLPNAGMGLCFGRRVHTLVDQILQQSDNELLFEKGKLSLQGCAGYALAMMTASGKCNDAWLDLLG